MCHTRLLASIAKLLRDATQVGKMGTTNLLDRRCRHISEDFPVGKLVEYMSIRCRIFVEKGDYEWLGHTDCRKSWLITSK